MNDRACVAVRDSERKEKSAVYRESIAASISVLMVWHLEDPYKGHTIDEATLQSI